MKNIQRLAITSALALALITTTGTKPAYADYCSNIDRGDVQASTSTIMGAITTMQQMIVIALLGVPSGSPEMNILSALNAESKARTGQQNVTDQQALANKEVDDKLEQVKANQENVVTQGRAIAEAAYEAGKKYQVTNEECVNMTNRINFEYTRGAARDSINQKVVGVRKWIDEGAPKGGPAYYNEVYQDWQTKRQSTDPNVAAENAPDLETAKAECKSPECLNNARANILKRIIASAQLVRPVPLSVARTAELRKYDELYQAWKQQYNAALEEVRRIDPKFQSSRPNSEAGLKAFQTAYGRQQGMTEFKRRFPWGDPRTGAGLNEMEVRMAEGESKESAANMNKKAGLNEHKKISLADIDAGLAKQIEDDKKDVDAYYAALNVLRTKPPVPPAGAMPRATGTTP